MEALTEHVLSRDARAKSGAPGPRISSENQGYLPEPGERFTEDQMREKLGVSKGGGIRPSLTSTDLVLVRNVHSDYNDVEKDKYIIYDGKYHNGPNQLISGNLKLAESKKNGNRVLYFVKEDGQLVFNGLVKYIKHYDKKDPSRPGAIAYMLEMIDPTVATGTPERQETRVDRPDDSPAPHRSSAPDLDMIMEVERRIFDRRRFTSRSELLATLDMDIDSAKLDRILEYLERSAKISTGDGSIRWSFSGSGPQEGLNTNDGRGRVLTTGYVSEEPAGILSRAEQLSADLDNDLPYSAETERLLADCEAGRPIGKTYTAEEYLRLLDQELDGSDLENPSR